MHSTSGVVRGAAAVCAAVAWGATPVSAQKPETRRVATVRSASLSTPARREATPARVQALRVPAGFRVSVFAEGTGAPRMMAVGPDGTVYVTRRDSNDVIALRDADGDGRAERMVKVASGIRDVHGIALHGASMYLATNREVYVAAVNADASLGTPRAIITDLPDAGQHPNRTLAVGPDSMLYITVGSTCNVCRESNEENATMLRAALDGSKREVFARGLRNTIGFGWQPATGEMWGWDQGFDWHGNDFPPEEFNKLQMGANYGWPSCYGAARVNEYYAGEPEGMTREAFCAASVGAALEYQAHSAGIQMAFYTGDQFPAEYRNDAFIALRGSWNREPPTGYKVVRVRFRDGRPTAITDFLTGFLAADGRSYFARPAGVAVARDGALLVSDDTNGMIYRVSHAPR